jgi:radical SAM protein with 4Fe4S-binding SPASM domain
MRNGKPHLTNVLFEVTPACNLACRYCYLPWKAPECAALAAGFAPPPAPSYTQASRTLKRLFALAKVGRVTFTGGEPFLTERLGELVLQCRLKSAAVTVISNGTVATRSDYRLMLDLGVSLFELPLHSARPEIHDAMTGQAGTWRRARRSLEDILELGGSAVSVIILTRLNCRDIASTLRLNKQLGIRQIMLNRFNLGGQGLKEAKQLCPTVAELTAAFHTADWVGRELGLVVSSNVGTPHCLVDPRDYPHLRFASCSADLHRRPWTLDLAGGLRFCNHSPVVIGNIHQQALIEILATDYLARWGCVLPDFCATCKRFPACFGGCRAAAEQMGLSLAHPDPLLTLAAARDSLPQEPAGSPLTADS